jgi:hypothetical protein
VIDYLGYLVSLGFIPVNQTHSFRDKLHVVLEFPEGEVQRELDEINVKLDKIMATAAELAGLLRQIGTQLDKAQTEILDAIAKLQQSELPADAAAALDELKVKVQALDDIVPDQPPA